MKNWLIFIKERFEPISHSIMILVFILVHYLITKKLGISGSSNIDLAILLIGVSLFYFKLRLYDEVKDYELDVVINKHRPLPRGLLNHQNMYNGMIFCILVELICFATQGLNSFISLSIAVLYSMLMYKEFFIKDKIRPLLTTYAIMHTIVTTLLSLAIFSFLSKLSFIEVVQNKYFIAFAIVNWLLFNVFEFGRKAFATDEEREDVDTYSSLFGRKGAALLVISQRILSVGIILTLDIFQTKLIIYSFTALLSILLIVSVKYILIDKAKNAKMFRMMSSVYIIIFYVILALGLL